MLSTALIPERTLQVLEIEWLKRSGDVRQPRVCHLLIKKLLKSNAREDLIEGGCGIIEARDPWNQLLQQAPSLEEVAPFQQKRKVA